MTLPISGSGTYPISPPATTPPFDKEAARDRVKFKFAVMRALQAPEPLSRSLAADYILLRDSDNENTLRAEDEDYVQWVEDNKFLFEVPWSLKLNNLGLHHLPKEIKLFTNLRLLDISDNPDLEVPDLSSLQHLAELIR